MPASLSAIPHRPIVAGFHPDPSVCRVGQDFYLVNSTFEYVPGVPVRHSRDLLEWTVVSHALDESNGFSTVGAESSAGIFAPTLRHHDGRFWMITTDQSGPPGQLLVTASDPAGPWTEPLRITDALGIDPDLAWDENDVCWMSWSGTDPVSGAHAILQARLDTYSGALLSPPRAVWHGTGGQYPEGPHLYRREGYWYLLIAEGGTERGHTVTIARATRPDGPFEEAPDGPLLTARSSDSPTQSVGHGDLVERADGTWAMLFLGTRPRGATPAWHVLGRETFACQIEWIDGWPSATSPIEPGASDVARLALQDELPPEWSTASGDARPQRVAAGWRLEGTRETAFSGIRQQHMFTRTRARLSAGSGAALQIRIDPRHTVEVRYAGGEVIAQATIGGRTFELGSHSAPPSAWLVIRTGSPDGSPGTPAHGPDRISAGFEGSDGYREVGAIDGRYLSTEVAGGFTGRFVGVVVGDGGVTIEAFDYAGSDDVEP